MLIEKERTSWLERPLASYLPAVNLETLLITLIMILAIFSRFYNLGARVMSHDETNHVVPSFSLYQGQGYQHDPITHGPFQFHIVALSYFLLGDSDFASRVPAALFSVATVFLGWFLFRRYFSKTGGLLAAFLLLISPYLLFYGRYTRNESFIALYLLVMLFAVLRYLETGRARYLTLFTLAVVMHVCSKETSFIYTAQALIFLAILLLVRVLNRPWVNPEKVRPFLLILLLAIILVGVGLGLGMLSGKGEAGSATPAENQPPQANSPTAAAPGEQPVLPPSSLPEGVIGLGLLLGAGSTYFLVSGYGLKNLRKERSFDLLLLLGTLVLPSLVALPLKLLKVNIPVNATEVNNLTVVNMVEIGAGILILFILSAAIGLWWNRRAWISNAAVYYAIFTVFYTTMFTNGAGFVTGIVGSLGYWLAQQGVQRGSQPWYFFALIQVPMYEYLPLIGTLLAFGLALAKKCFSGPFLEEPALEANETAMEDDLVEAGEGVSTPEPEAEAKGLPNGDPVTHVYADEYIVQEKLPLMALLIFWAASSLAAYSIAGEKMPWLTVHIATPMILCAAWAFGWLIDTTDWRRLWAQRGWLVVLLLLVFLMALISMMGSLLGANRPFLGNSIVQLQATANFISAVVGILASGAGLAVLLKGWETNQVWRLLGVGLLAVLAVQTARTAIRANYINYDTATEFLVYAHAARGPKEILAQVEEISKRTTGGLDIAVAYDNDSQYPYWWYFRRYPKKIFFAGNPTRELRNDPIVIVGEANFGKVDTILKDSFYKYEYSRLWWPMQGYFGLTWERIWYALKTPEMRAAIFDIWANDDFGQYAKITQDQTLSLTTWRPADRMRMYIRKDIVAQIWNYGVAPAVEAVPPDPYEKGRIQISADRIIGNGQGTQPGQFDAPRGIAVAKDGSLYVADSRNNRIQHMSADGTVLETWGTFADISKGDAPGGTFFEPWGVAVGPDGSVFVTDTWNSRVEKFTADGKFVKMWGYFGQAEKPEAFWGPRGIVVDGQGRVFIADTGNKRVVIFDSEGAYINSFGGAGIDPGQFDEPVGIAMDTQGNLYVADTWNQRMQAFSPDASGTNYIPSLQWDISGWTGQSVENKPFVGIDQAGHIFVTDPEAARVLEFNQSGQFLQTWGDPGSTDNAFGLASAVAVDADGGVWVSDSANHRLMHFVVPPK